MVAKYRNAAVQQFRSKDACPIDYYPTPAWATRALCEKLSDLIYYSGLTDREGDKLGYHTVLDPACGAGDMLKPLQEYAFKIYYYDLYDPADKGYMRQDYLVDEDCKGKYDWIITNPPFTLASGFARKGIYDGKVGCAMFGRIAFLESVNRYDHIFGVNPPTHVFVFSERVNITKGKVDIKATSAVCHAWYVWFERLVSSQCGYQTTLSWIEPGTRKRLEEESDYEL